MTPVSRSAPAPATRVWTNASSASMFSTMWHRSCFSLCMLAPLLALAPGCLDFRPVPWQDPNASPKPKTVLPDADSTISLGKQAQAVLVVVDDADPVTFIWSLSRDGYIGTATPIANGSTAQGSQITLGADSGLDGQTLTVVVSDGLSEDISFRWQLEVL